MGRAADKAGVSGGWQAMTKVAGQGGTPWPGHAAGRRPGRDSLAPN